MQPDVTGFALQEDRQNRSKRKAFISMKKEFIPKVRYTNLYSCIDSYFSSYRSIPSEGDFYATKQAYVPSFMYLFENHYNLEGCHADLDFIVENMADTAIQTKHERLMSRNNARLLCSAEEDPAVKLLIKNERTTNDE